MELEPNKVIEKLSIQIANLSAQLAMAQTQIDMLEEANEKNKLESTSLNSRTE